MTYRTASFVACESTLESAQRLGGLLLSACKEQDRSSLIWAFPYSIILELSFPELDYANRWCWQQFGPANGECLQAQSIYPACELVSVHSHNGVWMSDWVEKTDYDFGTNVWLFCNEIDRNRFLDFVPNIQWGENFPGHSE